MKTDSLPIPNALRDSYLQKGITELYPPQVECVNAGLFERKNILATIPTASGKTIIAEMAMHKEIARGGKCLYIVPLKALASEKYDDFSNKSVKVGIATGDPDQRDEYLGKYDIIVATSEKTDSLMRNKAEWLKRVSLLVIDEIHLIGDESRGATLEMVIAKFRFLNPELQIIGLSATIGNPEKLAGWLDAALITSDWRPVDLREGVYFNGAIHFHGCERILDTPKKDDDLNLMLDTISEGGQCLVFVSSRRLAETFAKRAAAVLKKESPKLDEYSNIIEKADTTQSGKNLAAAVKKGAAFHHAGLPGPARHAVEEGFRNGDICVISSTPTLAAGLNLPARRVIVRDYSRFESGLGMHPIPVMEYRQMAGRAGRPRLDPYGEAVLIAKEKGAVDGLFEKFIDAPAENIYSQCKKDKELRIHILALIASGFAENTEDITGFMSKSFYAFGRGGTRLLEKKVINTLEFLKKSGMIDSDVSSITPTMLGSITSKLYLDPESALMIVDALKNKTEEISAFGVLHLLCMTPNMFRFYLKSADEKIIDATVGERGDEFLCEELCEEFFGAVKTALAAEEWISEVSDDVICEHYGIGAGDVYAVVENLRWLIHAATKLAYEFAPTYGKFMSELEIRITHGVKEELIPLISLKGIGRVRARRLFNRGFDSPKALLEGDENELTGILGKSLTKSVLDQASRKISVKKKREEIEPDDDDENEKNTNKNERKSKESQVSLFDFGE